MNDITDSVPLFGQHRLTCGEILYTIEQLRVLLAVTDDEQTRQIIENELERLGDMELC